VANASQPQRTAITPGKLLVEAGTTMAQPSSKAFIAEDGLPAPEDMIPFNDVQAELTGSPDRGCL
jgi:hypothetical protein